MEYNAVFARDAAFGVPRDLRNGAPAHMKHRKLFDDFEISILTAGVFQLDCVAGVSDPGQSGDRTAALRCALDHGVNAINLGFPFYLDEPERRTKAIKELLAEGYGERVKIFLNLPVTDKNLRSTDALDALLEKQLLWFGLESVDCALIEDMDRFGWARFEAVGGVAWLRDRVLSGRVKRFGFDFRDDCFFLKDIFAAYDWSLAQFRYSFVDQNLHPGAGGFRYASDARAGVIVTEAFKGGRLLSDIPEEALKLYGGAKERRSVEEWALLWAWNEPAVSSVVVSAKDAEEARRYAEIADRQAPLDMAAKIMINKVFDVYRKRKGFNCTECRCCMPCPFGIDAPGIGALYNDVLMYGDEKIPKFLFEIRGFADPKCEECGICNKHCPRDYPIMEAVRAAQTLLGQA
jgi:predicted aldo/keto reductase-like oxidoreductase